MRITQPRRDERAPVAALHGKAAVAERQHQVGDAIGNGLGAEALLTRPERQAESR